MFPRNSPGFTMIEVIIAFSLTTILVMSVYSTTNSITALAQRQKAASAKDAERSRFLEILHRDLNGWISQEKEGADTSSDLRILFSFTTSADGLNGESADGLEEAARSANVQYLVQPVVNGDQVVRVEQCAEGQPLSLVVYHGESIRAEFFDGRKWVGGRWKSERPVAVRIISGSQTIYFNL